MNLRNFITNGEFINYEGKELVILSRLEVKFVEEPNPKSLVHIMAEAMKLKQQAEKAYADLAAQLAAPLGHTMFIKLSKEEHNPILWTIF